MSQTVEEKSFAAYYYLRTLPTSFSAVIFSSASHTGFYTIISDHQGLLQQDTKYILNVDDFSEKDVELASFPMNTHVVSDTNTLKKDFMFKETIRLVVILGYFNS